MWLARHHPKKYRHNLALVQVVHHRVVEMLDLVVPLQRAAQAQVAHLWVRVDSPLKVDRTWHHKAKLRWVKALDLICPHQAKALGRMHHHKVKHQDRMHHLKVKHQDRMHLHKVKVLDLICPHRAKALGRMHHHQEKALDRMHRLKVKLRDLTHLQVKRAQKAKVQTTHHHPTMSLKVAHQKAA